MTITPEDFASRTCRILIRKGELLEDSRPHHVLFDELKAMYPAIRAALWEEFLAEKPTPLWTTEPPLSVVDAFASTSDADART